MGGSLKKVNPLEYFLTPPVRVLSEEEKREILEKFSISEEQLPKIKLSDPVVKALKAKPGDVLEFMREDFTGKYPYYRVVVP